MLVLTRRVGETLQIDDRIQVKVLKSRGSVVRLRISAPKNVVVQRSENISRPDAKSLAHNPGDGAFFDAPIMDRLIRIAR